MLSKSLFCGISKQCHKKSFSTTATRCAGEVIGHYRWYNCPPMTWGPRFRHINFVKTVIWTHIWYTLWYQPEWVFGHKPECPSPHEYTDEELGIPPDDYDEVF